MRFNCIYDLPHPLSRTKLPVMLQTVDTLLYILLAIVFIVLMAGIYALFRGGDFGRSWSNRLMRARVLFQFLAVLVICLGFWLKSASAAG